MTNSYNDIRKAKTVIIMGGNPAEAHPVSLQHLLEGKELQPRELHRDRAAPDAYRGARERIRAHPLGHGHPDASGACCYHIFKNGWEDKEFIRQRVYGMDDIRKEVEKWTPEEVERVTGVPGAQLEARRREVREGKSVDARLVHGRNPAHGRHRERARVLHSPARHRQRRQAPATAPTSSAVTATCRARPTSASIS